MRSDILVSVGVVDQVGPQATVTQLKAVLGTLAQHFQYYELLYVVSEARRSEIGAMGPELSGLTHLRIVMTNEGTRFYHQRLVAVTEAIGDVAVLADLDEVSPEDIADLLGRAYDDGEILLGWLARRLHGGWGYRLLSLASRNRISARAARTIVLPRKWIGPVTARRSAALDLRFEPRIPATPYRRFPVHGRRIIRTSIGRRYELLIEILLSGVPRYLKAFAFTSFLVTLGSLAYAIYALAVMLLRPNIQEGWFSTAIIQAGSTGFIAGGMAILAVALIAIYERLHGGAEGAVVDEVSCITLFDEITERNVEITETAPMVRFVLPEPS